ncbi:tetratricopeptide repeat protein [Leadbettera azotonutricia]|uniref:Putative slei family protein n=1 Tax=Leadbettera azotonutricia (strain ATCC BAA-888 / DSM 13862 / ZAS-9) TaxID=545695 RepID=F5YDB8_LEAAZ|nr:tetratricopeptide repeat protein [Leadbettera azotonutricia]AEF80774.1 putative slei family protein [Leadbettera azotonutricia ZAS-9]
MSPIDIQDVLERARGSARVGDHEEAERLLKSYLAKKPDSREAHLLLGATLAREAKLTEAADEFTTLLAKNPQDIEALNNIAVIYRRQGKLQDALGALVEAIDLEPTKAEFHYNIGNIHKQMGNLKAASMAYAKVIELDPNYVSAYNNLGTIYDQLKEYDKAYGIFHKGLNLDRNNPTLHFNYGVALEANGRLEDAANEYRAALRSKPGWLEPMNNLGIIHFKQGRHDKALDVFNRIIDSDPSNAEARNNMGVIQADQGKNKEAVQNYRRAIEADPRYTKAVVNLERTLEESGDFANAVLELEKLVKLTPDSADLRDRLSGLYLKMERYPEALEQAKAALEWAPEDTQALRVLGAVQRITGNDEEAKAAFEKMLAIDPGNYSFHLDLADIHFKRKEYKEAEDCIMAYLARRPNDRTAKLLLGKLYAEMGNKAHAVQVFEELSKIDPNDTEALAATAELYKESGSVEKALRTADALVNLQGKRATSDDLSELNKSLDFYENAVNTYSSSVKEMWDRNMKILGGGEEHPDEESDLSLLLGSAGISQAVDEETEALFIEDDEVFAEDEMPVDDFAFSAEPFMDLDEEGDDIPQPKDPFDSLVDPSDARPPQQPSPQQPAPLRSAPLQPVPPAPQPKAPLPSAPPEPEIEAEEDAELEIDPELPPLEESLEGEGEEEEAVIGEESPEDLSEPEPEDSFLDLAPDEEAPELHEESPGMEIPVEKEPPAAESAESIEELNIDEAPAEENIEVKAMLDLLKNLKSLVDSLPEKNKSDFLASDWRLGLEFIIDVFEGRKGLFRDIEERKGESVEEIEVLDGPDPDEAAETLGYLEGLATELPDPELSAAIARKAEPVITGLKESAAKSREAHEA